jgi:hypothetical protein
MDFIDRDLRGTRIERVRMRGVEIVDVEISGELRNVVVNGVDVAPLVEAELDRQLPDRAKMRPTDVQGFRQGWVILERLWEQTIARARTFPDPALHESVDGEWSFIETLRHLGFASASWVDRMVLGEPSPWHPLDLPWDEAPGWDDIPCDRAVRPSLDEVLVVRRARQATVRDVIASLTPERLATVISASGPGWPPPKESMPVADCLLVLLNEEWHHRLFAERDLTALEARAASPQAASHQAASHQEEN